MYEGTSVETLGRAFMGIDRGFLYNEDGTGMPWNALVDVEETEDDFRIEKYFVDGRLVGYRHIAGNYSAKVTSLHNPFKNETFRNRRWGFTYRENYTQGAKEMYRLHLIHGVSIFQNSSTVQTVNATPNASTFSFEMHALDVPLSENIRGSHLILDTSDIYPWIMRDVEAILYGWEQNPRIPSIDEMYEIFAQMNFVIIDHGDGTWSAVGHESMIQMLDPLTFEINSPTAVYLDEDTYEVESLIRNDGWLR